MVNFRLSKTYFAGQFSVIKTIGDAGLELLDSNGVRQSAGRDEFQAVGEHEDADFGAADRVVAVDAGVDQQLPQHFVRRKRLRIDPFSPDDC